MGYQKIGEISCLLFFQVAPGNATFSKRDATFPGSLFPGIGASFPRSLVCVGEKHVHALGTHLPTLGLCGVLCSGLFLKDPIPAQSAGQQALLGGQIQLCLCKGQGRGQPEERRLADPGGRGQRREHRRPQPGRASCGRSFPDTHLLRGRPDCQDAPRCVPGARECWKFPRRGVAAV